MKRLFVILFVLTFFVGSFLRLYRLGDIPNSLNWDEASWGYNAYSILKTGHDEHGKSFPVSFEAFGDYKQPVYVYLDSAAVALFGLTPFAVRLPSSIFGILCMPFLAFLVYELLRKKAYAKEFSLAAMAFLAISPWAIQFSRVAYEATVALGFVLLGVLTPLLCIKSKKFSVDGDWCNLSCSKHLYVPQRKNYCSTTFGWLLCFKSYLLVET